MNPLRLRCEAYRTFSLLEFDLPAGLVAILGENGAGKSSLVDAIDLAIFGPDSGRSLADYRADTAGPDEDLVVQLELEHAGEQYRIRRTYSPRGRGKHTLDLERQLLHQDEDVCTWEPLTRESVKETQAEIERILGLSRETFRASAFLAQADGAAFTEASPRDRKRILAEVLQLDRYDRLLDRARRDRRETDTLLERLAGRTETARTVAAEKETVEAEAARLSEQIAVGADETADLDRQHRQLAEQWQAAREQAARIQACEAELREARHILSQLEARELVARESQAAIGGLEPELAALEEQAARLPVLLAAAEKARDDQAAYERALAAAREETLRRNDLLGRASERRARAEALRSEATTLEAVPLDEDARCDHCGQLLGLEAREQRLAKYQADAARIDEEANRLDADAAAIVIPPVPDPPRTAVEDPEPARRADTQASALRERLAHLRAQAAAGPDPTTLDEARAGVAGKQAALDALPPVDLAVLEQEGRIVAGRLDQARRALEAARLEAARLDERLIRIRDAEAEVAAAAAEEAQLARRQEIACLLERAFGPNGVPMLIVESTAIPYLEAEASRILAELGTSYQVELRTQAALKSGDGLRDTLDVIVTTEQGERAYETFSGGEKTRLNLALRVALARLLAHRRGAESRLLCIDEPEFLDEQGTAALVGVLQGLQDDFDRIYLISHVPALRDSFDQVLQVRRDTTGSRLDDQQPASLEVVA